jgi:hypothetical protein
VDWRLVPEFAAPHFEVEGLFAVAFSALDQVSGWYILFLFFQLLSDLGEGWGFCAMEEVGFCQGIEMEWVGFVQSLVLILFINSGECGQAFAHNIGDGFEAKNTINLLVLSTNLLSFCEYHVSAFSTTSQPKSTDMPASPSTCKFNYN